MANIYRNKFLVIDNQDLLDINNLTRKVNAAVKHPEPVLTLDAPWNRASHRFDAGNVLYDEEEKRFKMWYLTVSLASKSCPTKGDNLGERIPVSYAASPDGIHWEKPILNRVEFHGSKENNFVYVDGPCDFIRDESDPPARRYKAILAYGESGPANFHVPLSLAYSPDGFRWDVPIHVNPILRGVSDGPHKFFYDADRRKYRLYTRRVPNLPRDISLYESYDLVNWEDKGRVLVAGDAYDPPEVYNFHTLTPFRYGDFYLGLLDTMYTLPEAETYENYNAPPPDYPNKRIGQVEIQLAYSRDGTRWSRLKDRSTVIPNGEPGAPDEGIAASWTGYPIVRNGETWIYYAGMRVRHNYWSEERMGWQYGWDWRKMGFGMLAKMPEDHWVSLDAGPEGGSFLTKPWHMGLQLLVNADARGGSIEAELLTPYGEPVPGFTRAECIPVTGNGKDQEIKWKSGLCGWDLNNDYRGGVLTKFYLKSAKLYSYTVTEPDPDGAISRHWANFRWTEVIKHKSDNWDRLSTEPAVGLPPYTGQ